MKDAQGLQLRDGAGKAPVLGASGRRGAERWREQTGAPRG